MYTKFNMGLFVSEGLSGFSAIFFDIKGVIMAVANAALWRSLGQLD